MARTKKLKKSVKTRTFYRVWWTAGHEDFKTQRDAQMLMEFLQDYVSVHFDVFAQNTITFSSEKEQLM